MGYFQNIEDHERLGIKLKELSETTDLLSKTEFRERPGLAPTAKRVHEALKELRHELEELALRQFPDTDSSRLRACYYPGPDSRGHTDDRET